VQGHLLSDPLVAPDNSKADKFFSDLKCPYCRSYVTCHLILCNRYTGSVASRQCLRHRPRLYYSKIPSHFPPKPVRRLQRLRRLAVRPLRRKTTYISGTPLFIPTLGDASTPSKRKLSRLRVGVCFSVKYSLFTSKRLYV